MEVIADCVAMEEEEGRIGVGFVLETSDARSRSRATRSDPSESGVAEHSLLPLEHQIEFMSEYDKTSMV
jgi:hypothetical protein